LSGSIDCDDFRGIRRKERTTWNEWRELANNTNLELHLAEDHLYRIKHAENCEIMEPLNQR
jgi:hypothetical protein